MFTREEDIDATALRQRGWTISAIARHQVRPCPPRRGNRKGVVEKANHAAAQRWWRTLADDVSVEQA